MTVNEREALVKKMLESVRKAEDRRMKKAEGEADAKGMKRIKIQKFIFNFKTNRSYLFGHVHIKDLTKRVCENEFLGDGDKYYVQNGEKIWLTTSELYLFHKNKNEKENIDSQIQVISEKILKNKMNEVIVDQNNPSKVLPNLLPKMEYLKKGIIVESPPFNKSLGRVTDISQINVRRYIKHYAEMNRSGQVNKLAGREYCIVQYRGTNFHCQDMDVYEIFHYHPEDFISLDFDESSYLSTAHSLIHSNDELKKNATKPYDPVEHAKIEFKRNDVKRACEILYYMGFIESRLNNQMAADFLGVKWDGINQQ